MNNLNVALESEVKPDKNQNLLILLLGRIISETGSSMFRFALSLYVLDITGSPVAFSMIFGFATVAGVLVNLFAGFIADKCDRKKVLVATDLLCGLLVLIFIPIFGLSPKNIVNLVIYAMAIGTLQAMFELTINAIIPDVFAQDDVGKANSALQSVLSLIGIFGVLIGGIAYNKLSMNLIFGIDAISFIISGCLACFLKYIKDKREDRSDFQTDYWETVTEIFTFLKSKADIRFFLIFATAFTFVFNTMVILVLPYIGYNLIRVSAFQLSLIEAAWSVGLIIGAIYVSAHKSPEALLKKCFFYLQIESISIIFWIFPLVTNNTAYSKWPVCMGYCFLLLLLGLFNSLQSIPLITYFQNIVPEQLRARFFGVFNTAILVACPFGMFIYGALLSKVYWAYLPLISGCCMLTAGILTHNSKALARHLKNLKPN